MLNINYEAKFLEIQNLIKQWEKRYISVLGRITVVKTLLLSKLTHLFISLPKPNINLLNQLEKTLYQFVWGGSTDRISRNQLIQDYEDGGLRMPRVPTFIKSLKLTWFRRLFTTESSWKNLFSVIVIQIIQNFFNLEMIFTVIWP